MIDTDRSPSWGFCRDEGRQGRRTEGVLTGRGNSQSAAASSSRESAAVWRWDARAGMPEGLDGLGARFVRAGFRGGLGGTRGDPGGLTTATVPREPCVCTTALLARSRAARVSPLELEGRLRRKSLRLPERLRRRGSASAPDCLGDIARGDGWMREEGDEGEVDWMWLTTACASLMSAEPVLLARRRVVG